MIDGHGTVAGGEETALTDCEGRIKCFRIEGLQIYRIIWSCLWIWHFEGSQGGQTL